MSAVRQLWMQLWRRMPTLVVLANLLWLGALGMAVYSLRGEHDLIYISASLIGFGSGISARGRPCVGYAGLKAFCCRISGVDCCG